MGPPAPDAPEFQAWPASTSFLVRRVRSARGRGVEDRSLAAPWVPTQSIPPALVLVLWCQPHRCSALGSREAWVAGWCGRRGAGSSPDPAAVGRQPAQALLGGATHSFAPSESAREEQPQPKCATTHALFCCRGCLSNESQAADAGDRGREIEPPARSTSNLTLSTEIARSACCGGEERLWH
jgi:hypothetical protein